MSIKYDADKKLILKFVLFALLFIGSFIVFANPIADHDNIPIYMVCIALVAIKIILLMMFLLLYGLSFIKNSPCLKDEIITILLYVEIWDWIVLYKTI